MKRTVRLAAVTVALAAMLLRALVPMGWMPAQGASLVICTMQGPVRIALDDRGNSHKPQDTHRAEVCPFAAAPALPGPTVVAEVAPPSPQVNDLERSSASAFIQLARSRTPQSPRAPPLLA